MVSKSFVVSLTWTDQYSFDGMTKDVPLFNPPLGLLGLLVERPEASAPTPTIVLLLSAERADIRPSDD